jgi:hypothetical protein
VELVASTLEDQEWYFIALMVLVEMVRIVGVGLEEDGVFESIVKVGWVASGSRRAFRHRRGKGNRAGLVGEGVDIGAVVAGVRSFWLGGIELWWMLEIRLWRVVLGEGSCKGLVAVADSMVVGLVGAQCKTVLGVDWDKWPNSLDVA